MPKWNDRPPVAPMGGGLRAPAPVVDISPRPADLAPAPRGDPRVPAIVKAPSEVIVPEVKYLEKLRLDRTPTPEGVRYEIENIGGMHHYSVVIRHRGTGAVFASQAKSREGHVQVTGLSKMSGVWDALLMVNLEVADRTEVELELTQEWLAELVGKASVFFASTDGPMDRIGTIVLTPNAKKTPVASTDEDVAICILLNDLPEVIPKGAKVTLQILRPNDAGIYYRAEAHVAHMACYRMMLANYLPCSEPGDWQVVVMMGSKVLANETLKIAGRRAPATKTQNPVEEFNGRIVG